MCHVAEKEAIDKVIDYGPQLANDVDYKVLHGMLLSLRIFLQFLIYLTVVRCNGCRLVLEEKIRVEKELKIC